VISTIIPCYNSEKYIARTIKSIINQTFQRWELIIVNDGSTDNSVKEILKYAERDPRIKLFNIENGGVTRARNFGYSKINDEFKYLHFLDSDDMIEPSFYSKLISFLEVHNDYGAVYSNHKFINEVNQELPTPIWGERLIPTRFWIKKLPEEIITTPFISIALWCKMVESMVIMKKSEFEKSKKWDEAFGYGKIGEGVVLFSELALNSKIGYLSEKLFLYRRHVNQSSQNNLKQFNSFELTSMKILESLKIKSHKKYFQAVICRNEVYFMTCKLKHLLRYKPWLLPFISCRIIINYLRSAYLIFGVNTLK
jgi:glycosyltransferase involved in cell wall biosynthesis